MYMFEVFREAITKYWMHYQLYHKEWGEKFAARTLVNKCFNNEQKHTNDSVRNEHIVDFKKETKKEGVVISVLNVFLPIFSLWFSILNNLLIMDSLIDIMKNFHSRFFTMFPFYTTWNYPSKLWFSDVFREYKRGTLGRNRSSFLTHFRPVFHFCTPCERQKTLGLLLFPGG